VRGFGDAETDCSFVGLSHLRILSDSWRFSSFADFLSAMTLGAMHSEDFFRETLARAP
jgi:hypothetical protein